MTNCEYCRDRLLEHVYGLLEENDLQELGEHLADCSDCQAALEEVRAEQQLLANAARAIMVVPEFALPASQPASVPDTLPLSRAPAPNLAAWRRPWLAWTAAAVVLLAVGGSLSYYRHTVHDLQAELTAKRQEYKKASEEFAALPARYEALQQAAIRDLQAKSEAYLHVVGPTTLVPGASGHLHVTTRNGDGTPAKADLRIKLIEAEPDGKILQVLRLPCDQQAVAELDASAAKPNSALNVIIEADVGPAKARIQESLRTLAPSYVTRLDTSKLAYQYKDVLFFRVLVLDRYSLVPPSQPIAMRVELRNPAGQPVRSLDLATADGGILAREFAIDETLPTGSYTLAVRPVDPGRIDVASVSQRLEIVRELGVPDLVFNQERYKAGEQLSGIFRGAQALPEKAMIGDQAVPITKAPAIGAFSAPGGLGGGGAKAKGEKKQVAAAPPLAQPFTLPIPPNLPPGASRVPITMKVGDGKMQREVRGEIQLAPTEFSIDFFPEGGDLIAGVENRVYYRVRSKAGEPVTGDGSVILLSTKNEVVDSTYQLGMGYFEFTPHAKETYTVRITTPVKTETVANPFAKLGIRTDGVVVHVPNAVGGQGDAIRLTLRHQGPARKLLLVAQCRGQIIDQRWVEVKNKNVDLVLQPTRDAVGMIRVTAYELQDKQTDKKEQLLVPVAERLVYRGASQRLELGFKLNTQQLHGGQKLSAKVSARDEKGRPAPAWLLASVIDERFQAKPRSLSAHFFLLNEVRSGPDLDQAQVILHDGSEAVAMLERFLGTHGWRRFVRSQEPSLGLLADPAKRPPQPLVFSRENQPLDAMQEQREQRFAAAVAPIRAAGFRAAEDLSARCDSLLLAVKTAGDDLHRFEEAVQVWFRLGLGMLLALLLAVSLTLMGVGVYRIVRAHKLATPSFASAFACLTAGMGVFLLGSWLGPLNVFVDGPGADLGAAAQEIGKQLDRAFTLAPADGLAGPRPVTGGFALQASNRPEPHDGQGVAAKKAEQEQAKDAMQVLRFQLENSLARRDATANSALLAANKDRKNLLAENIAMTKRFHQSLAIGKGIAKADAGPPIPTPGKGPDVPKVLKQALPLAGPAADAYVYEYAPNLLTDTLLWHPTLWLQGGSAEVRFDMAAGQATYRVMLLGHSPAGRFGFYEMRLDVPEVGR